MSESSTGAAAAYERLAERAERAGGLETIDNLLFWDQQVMMPPGGTPGRSMQRGLVSTLQHEAYVGDDVASWLDAVDGAELDADQSAVVREVRREHERRAAVPQSLEERRSEVVSEANEAWEDARENDDFETFAPYLSELLELTREKAAAIDPDREPFAVILGEYEPYLDVGTVESVFDDLRRELVPLLAEIRASDVDPGGAFAAAAPYDVDAQMALSEAALSFVGCDWDRARLDTATHPFSFGNRHDMRITTRFDESSPVTGLMSSLHEYGHASYEHGLDPDRFPGPLGQSRSHGIHESQSRFWENHVGRTETFWRAFLPTVRDQFPALEDVTPEAAYGAANQVNESNLIRVDADEVSYHLHVLIRFEIERDLLNGDLAVEDVPAVWNDKYEEYLGIRPAGDSDGCLQDIHWSIGRIGSFQGYTLGTMFAAQLTDAMAEELGEDIESLIADRRFDDMRAWMGEQVHRHGKRYPTDELVEVATGEPLTAAYYLDYAIEKYEALYDL
ncbi:MAG: carboxypeptidase M32 [Halolamina sp.]